MTPESITTKIDRSVKADASLAGFLSLDEMITEARGWASALEAMGESPSLIDPGALRVIGRALDLLVVDMRAHWEEARRQATVEAAR